MKGTFTLMKGTFTFSQDAKPIANRGLKVNVPFINVPFKAPRAETFCRRDQRVAIRAGRSL
jgi:hypothetical protein